MMNESPSESLPVRDPLRSLRGYGHAVFFDGMACCGRALLDPWLDDPSTIYSNGCTRDPFGQSPPL